MARTAAEALEAAGWTVDLDDLVREGFVDDLTREDLKPGSDADLVQIMWEQEAATERDGYAPEVLDQMRRLQAADLVITVFPFWWFSVPGILKSWIDRIFANGVGYGHDPYVEGPLKGKRALAAVAIGGSVDNYGPGGTMGDIHALLNPLLHGTFGYAAMGVLDPFLVYEADGRDDAYRAAELARLRERLAGISDEAPIATAPLKAQ
jgi:NAD(P)H dehydrogenase (quinone)